MDEAERLVEADALLAKDDLRGELIVVQCELERGGFTRERGIALRRREQELLVHAGLWAGLDGLASHPVFRRGFLDEITIPIGSFIDHEPEIWKRAPKLRWLHFIGAGYDSPIDDLGDAALEWDKVWPRLELALASGRVRWFSARDARVSWMHDGAFRYRETGSLAPSIVRWLIESGKLEHLRGLALDGLDREAFRALAEAPNELDELYVQGAFVGVADPKLRPRRLALRHSGAMRTTSELLAGPLVSRVEHLEVPHLAAVLESECASRVRSLCLTSFDPADTALHALRLDALRTLCIAPRIDVEVARALLRSPLASRLELIDLRTSHLDASRLEWDGVLLVD